MRRLVPAGILAAAGAGLLAAADRFPAFAEWYRENVYRWISAVFSGVSGIFPFSLSEIGIYLLLAVTAADLVRCLALAGSGESRIRKLSRLGIRLLTAAAVLWFLYAANCGVNYRSRAFSELAGLEPAEGSVEELDALCGYLTEEIRKADAELGIGESGVGQTADTPAPDSAYFRRTGNLCRMAMESLGETWPELRRRYPMPKPILGSRFFSSRQITGIYSPFTVEANVNREIPYYNIPFTMCHELSHLCGFMREDEANFIAFLALAGAEDEEIRRSGLLCGFVYAGNALAAADPERYSLRYGELADADRQDLAWNNEFWDQFQGKAAETHEKVNDAYLRANGQAEGTASYGRMVDLMLAWYEKL
jgi:hypothetical protein